MDRPRQIFHWVGADQTGQNRQGEIDAPSITAARIALFHRGISCKQLKAVKNRSVAILPGALMADFLQQLALATTAGTHLAAALELLVAHSDSKHRREWQRIHRAVANGMLLSDALAPCCGGRNNAICELISAGEQSGKMGLMLTRAAGLQEQLLNFRRSVVHALIYPAILLIAAGLVGSFLLLHAVPLFAQTYSHLGHELPMLTQHIIALSEVFGTLWLPLLALTAGSVLVLLSPACRPKAKAVGRWILEHLPLSRQLLRFDANTRFCQVAAITLEAGLPLPEALLSSAKASGSQALSDLAENIGNQLAAGTPLAVALKEQHILPPLLEKMVANCSHRDQLVTIFNLVGKRCQHQTELAGKQLIIMIEPLTIAILGVFTGILVLAIYLPIFQLGNITH